MSEKLQEVSSIKQKLDSLNSEKSALEKALQVALSSAKNDALAEIAAKCLEFSINPDELPHLLKKPITRLQKVMNKKEGTSRKVKYRNPETGQTWSGVGKTPIWLKNKEKSQYLV